MAASKAEPFSTAHHFKFLYLENNPGLILYILSIRLNLGHTIKFQKLVKPEQITRQLVETIKSRLDVGTVLWLVSGGSAIQIAVAVSNGLAGRDLSKLTVTLADERYGKPGHADSNWQQLLEAGFSLPGATLVPVLTGADMETTTEEWRGHLTHLLNVSKYRIGLLGIGPDGHTSGILPSSGAITSHDLVTSYDGGGYQRITTTPAGLRRLDEAVVYAVGESKRTALQNLQKSMSISEQPAQLLKLISKVTVYNDEIGGTQ